MKYFYYILFFVLSFETIQNCSFDGREMGMLQQTEYKLWPSSSIDASRNQNFQNVEPESENDAIDCQTKIVNSCLICLASMPCGLYIASFFMN